MEQKKKGKSTPCCTRSYTTGTLVAKASLTFQNHVGRFTSVYSILSREEKATYYSLFLPAIKVVAEKKEKVSWKVSSLKMIFFLFCYCNDNRWYILCYKLHRKPFFPEGEKSDGTVCHPRSGRQGSAWYRDKVAGDDPRHCGEFWSDGGAVILTQAKRGSFTLLWLLMEAESHLTALSGCWKAVMSPCE